MVLISQISNNLINLKTHKKKIIKFLGETLLFVAKFISFQVKIYKKKLFLSDLNF